MRLNGRQAPITSDDPFLLRICKALNLTPRELAKCIDTPYVEIEPLLTTRWMLADTDRSDVWFKISEYTRKRLGELMVAQSELTKITEQHRTQRVARLAAMGVRGKRERPKRASEQ